MDKQILCLFALIWFWWAYSCKPAIHSFFMTQLAYVVFLICRVPRMCRRTLGERSFQYIGPVIWNSLSFSVRHAMSLSSFKSKLKTHLFSSAYWFLAFFLPFPSNPWLLCLRFLRCGCVWCLWVCVRVWVWHAYLICFVSVLGSHEMGRHKLPIIIIIIIP